ncbi:MAG: GntR family transcriptional regulator, partial [Myxococcota bacterium]
KGSDRALSAEHRLYIVYSMQLSHARPNLSTVVAEQIRERVVSGELPAGERVNEVRLAEGIGVSRTPLREALTRLVGEGFLLAAPRRGYFVPPLDPSEVQQLYVMRQFLDPAALRLGGSPPKSTLKRLRTMNREIERTRSPRKVIELDDEWHFLLLSSCDNQYLLNDIRRYMALTRRYEFAYFKHAQSVQVATEEHEVILLALEQGELDAACAGLKQNMSSAVDPLIEWLSS